MSPWAAQMSVMPRYIRKKKTSKSCDCAKANTVMPATLVNVQPDSTCTWRKISDHRHKIIDDHIERLHDCIVN